MPLQRGLRICGDKYEVLDLLDEGGFARVWRAQDLNNRGTLVAIKELKVDELLDQELRNGLSSFQKEAMVSAQLKSVPNVVRVRALEPSDTGEEPLLVLEYMPGGDLRQRIAQHQDGLPVVEALWIALDICSTLAVFHRLPSQPIHRDIKPSNILFSENGTAHLSDFGLTQLPGESERSYGRSRHPGTPLYMAPEQQTELGSLRPAADIYALGCVLFEMLTGKAYKRVAAGTSPSSLRPELPRELDEILARALAERPEDRFESATALKAALQPLCEADSTSQELLFGQYRIEELVGSGAYGEVYRATNTNINRTVALKFLHPLLMSDSRWVKRFRREALILARLKHPRIVPIHDVVQEKGRLFLVMDFIDGPTLAQHLEGRGQLPWYEMLKIVREATEALDYAHGEGILHRDLKPANIMLGPDGALLTDFGVSSLIDESSMSASLSGGIFGSPNYIPPEVWNNEQHTRTTDNYALACIVYELLTGEKLFDGQNIAAIIGAHNRGPVFPEEWPAGVPEGLNGVLEKALAKEPQQRFLHSGEMASALAALGERQDTVPVATAVAAALAVDQTKGAATGPYQDTLFTQPDSSRDTLAAPAPVAVTEASAWRRFLLIIAAVFVLAIVFGMLAVVAAALSEDATPTVTPTDTPAATLAPTGRPTETPEDITPLPGGLALTGTVTPEPTGTVARPTATEPPSVTPQLSPSPSTTSLPTLMSTATRVPPTRIPTLPPPPTSTPLSPSDTPLPPPTSTPAPAPTNTRTPAPTFTWTPPPADDPTNTWTPPPPDPATATWTPPPP